jgi:hypothetical protein
VDAEKSYYALSDLDRNGAFEIKKGLLITLFKALAAGGEMPR